ncbi:MGMT family protein [Parashewanella curva]|uniref:MGMT family protein n=2 Tax=Parashewanella curva TaxID=2338552 RepID=A0A3L8PTE4_9GAMM|nr:MGMT family protein [Parashewanella curva]
MHCDNEQQLTPIQRILMVVDMIPEGKVTTYGQVADLAGLPKRARLVSKALKSSPPSRNTPWHRVINSQGKISLPKDSHGYRTQIELLRCENIEVNQGKVRLSDYKWQPCIATLVMDLPF